MPQARLTGVLKMKHIGAFALTAAIIIGCLSPCAPAAEEEKPEFERFSVKKRREA